MMIDASTKVPLAVPVNDAQLQAPPKMLQPHVPFVLQQVLLTGGKQPLHELHAAPLPPVEPPPPAPL
ncbi:MAG TPA: hypothetical protein VMF89_06130 [Polyangiales bacterium]|nr:hypothetical protein [Polyangiales bacterium]